jgi:hypothetical protein
VQVDNWRSFKSNPRVGREKGRGRGVEKRMMGGARDDGVEAARRARSL